LPEVNNNDPKCQSNHISPDAATMNGHRDSLLSADFRCVAASASASQRYRDAQLQRDAARFENGSKMEASHQVRE
jgi:hypothetical protein